MTANGVVRLLPDGELEWLDAASAEPRRGRPESGAIAAAGGLQVLVPGEDVLVTAVQVAARQRHRLLQALPYAMEDRLVEDIDRQHFALGPTFAPNTHLVAAVDRERMEDWLEQLAAMGITPRALIPDTLAVAPGDAAVVLLDGERALLRRGVAEALAVASAELPDVLALVEAGEVTVLGRGEWTPGPGQLRQATADHALGLLVDGLGKAPVVNLLQGAYATGDEQRQRTRRVAVIAALAWVLALALETGARTVGVLGQRGQARALEAQSVALLRERFPDIRRVVDPRLQMQQRLAELGGGAGSTGAVGLLRLAGPALAADARVVLSAMSYRQGVLTVELEAPDFPRIESLRQRLVAADLDARLESSSSLDDRATARLRIGGRR